MQIIIYKGVLRINRYIVGCKFINIKHVINVIMELIDT